MLHSLRDIKKTNSKKYGGVGETLLRQNFSLVNIKSSFVNLSKQEREVSPKVSVLIYTKGAIFCGSIT
jgi:hypothetical protein